MRTVFDWNIGSRSLQLGKRTVVMGVLNVTPDSFSDGGLYLNFESAIEHGLKLIEAGADILDVGGESTRPGASVASEPPKAAKPDKPLPPAVKAEEELARIIPVIQALKQKRPDAIVSVDTYKANVARAALGAGAEIVNDVSGFRWDPLMKTVVAEMKCGAVLMHSRGRPEEWSALPPISDMVTLVKRELRQWVDDALLAGVRRDRIVLDPGFGFGKRLEENYPLLKRFEELHQLHYPLLAGLSRKSFIGRAIARKGSDAAVTDRLHGTLAAETAAILKGAHIVRTHDVRASLDAARVADLVGS
ncbi:MAG: dihydropteroate synthase [Acidobacteriota bacterium]|nr:dihydropteroate synthase [Acidobacteriota bacterium]